jgi:PAS domain S-box-containing protein
VLPQFFRPARTRSILVGVPVFFGLYLISRSNFTVFHSLAELFSVIIACGIFVVAWNTRSILENNYLLFIGVSFLFVGILELASSISVIGITASVEYDANTSAQLRVATRYVHSLSFLIAPLFVKRRPNAGWLFVAFTVVTTSLLVSILRINVFPNCYVDGVGLTSFDRISGYFVVSAFMASGLALFRYRRLFNSGVLNRIAASICFSVASDIVLTLYSSPTDTVSFVGHALEILGFYFIYEAVIVTGLKNPRDLLLSDLNRSESQLRSIAITAGDAIICVDSRGNVTFWNPSAESIFGFTAQELMGRNLIPLIPERYRELHSAGLRRVMESEENTLVGKTVEMEGLRKDESEFPVEISLTSWRSAGQKFFTAVVRDITERRIVQEKLLNSHAELEDTVRKRTSELLSRTEKLNREMEERITAEDALRESETKYRIIADNTRDWEWWLGPDGRFIYVSPSCKDTTGYTPEEFLSDHGLISRIIHPDDKERFESHVHEVDRQLVGGEVEFRIVRRDGTIRWVAHVCRPVFGNQGEFLGHRGSNRDITQKHDAEESLRDSESALRLLSGQLLTVQETEKKRIARELHDGINQMLAAVKFGLESKLNQMDRTKAPDGVSLENIIELVRNGIEEARRIQMDLRPAILDDLGILATISWLTREFQMVYKHIRIETQTDLIEDDIPEPLKLVVFRILQEALNNVARHSGADTVQVSLGKNGNKIELFVADNGTGFDIETTRKGLGLTSMRERTELSTGAFEIQSVTGRGTTIKSYWPIDE